MIDFLYIFFCYLGKASERSVEITGTEVVYTFISGIVQDLHTVRKMALKIKKENFW